MAVIGFCTKGATNYSVELTIVDDTDGTPETGVVYNTAGIDLWYRREGAAKTSITEATLAALTTAHSDGGFLHIGDGVYRLDLPDAAVATGADFVSVGGTATGMIVVGGRVVLTDFDLRGTPDVNVAQVSGDSTAADNLEAAFDGSGMTEPSAVPAFGTTTLSGWVAWLGALARNKMTQTATTATLRTDADDGDIATSTVSDNGTTYTRGEWS